ncbi:hypothetical protein J3L16_07190 [Alteromonas sp. 5E99-2]|nr:hypothetical protein [Alteromonas sp. 5E99-2]MBO1255467.1 hypothetical protein [Alteromonas sp. 5E99-2]
MKVKVATLDAFIDCKDGGNSACVVFNADALTPPSPHLISYLNWEQW